jgi:autotransporter-associated beta strand protein
MLPGIVVSNATKDYIFGGNGKISGITGLYKAGPGKLSILTTNDFTGATILLGGTVEFTNANSLGVVNANGSRGVNTDYFIDGVTLRYVGNVNGALPRPAYIQANNVTVDVISATNELSTSQVFGVGGLTKIGPGSLQINADASYSGGTIISNGTLRITSGSRIGTGPVTLAGGTLYFSGGVFTLTNALNVIGTGSRIINTNPYITSGLWSGSGSLAISNTSTLSLSNSIAGYSGAITVSTNAGNLRFNTSTNANNCTGSAAASFDLGTGSASISNFNGAGLTYHLGSLSGGPNTVVAGRFSNAVVHAASSIYSIGGNGQSTVFSGRILNGADTVSVVKVGAGTLALNGVNLYTGSTTVSNGTLGGNGVISGPLTVTAGGTLAPGTSVGKLTVSNSVTLSGTTLMELDRIGGVSTNDQLAGNSITGGGALIVTNIGPGIFNNTTFKLFSVPVSGFATVSLPTTGPTGPYVWTNTISTDGSIKLLSGGTVNTNPPTIASFTSGGGTTLNLSWPADHIGWSLQVQTNAITVGISTNWTLVGGSSNSNTATITIDPIAPTVFYRLIYP